MAEDRVEGSSRVSFGARRHDKGVQFIERSVVMKCSRLLLSAALAVGLQSGLGHASPYPSDGEAPYTPPPLDTYADQHARTGETPDTWGVSKRTVEPHDPFPFGGGYIDD
jgi:hypothetical protein